jgi:hypothetical protein
MMHPTLAEVVMMRCTQFDVARNALDHVAISQLALPSLDELTDDCLLVRVDRFAFTANNITYAMLGDRLRYWDLFRAPSGFGNIPVWGFGEVLVSMHPQIAAGERLFGCFPMATHLVIEAADVTARGLRDGAAHRQGVAPVYNAYARVDGHDAFAGGDGDYQALLRPLFMLSFLVDDFLAEAAFFGAGRVVLSSASSKTAFGLAHLLRAQRRPVHVTGLTSAAHRAFVRSLDCYDDIVAYDDVETLAPGAPTAFVDMAGSADVRSRLHRHLGDRLVYSGRVGLTHQDDTVDQPLPGAAPTRFFAPDQISKRAQAWGQGGLDRRFRQAWEEFLPLVRRSLTIVESHGPEAVTRIYRDALAGRIAPNLGHIMSLADQVPGTAGS